MDGDGNQWATQFFTPDAVATSDTQRGQQTDAAIFSFDASKKWIILEGLKGISRGGSGASIARGSKKARGFLTSSPDSRSRVRKGNAR